MFNKKIILGLILSVFIVLCLVGMICSHRYFKRIEKSIAIPSINEEVLDGLSNNERTFLETSIRQWDNESKIIVENVLSKISEEERVKKIKEEIIASRKIAKRLKVPARLIPTQFIPIEALCSGILN